VESFELSKHAEPRWLLQLLHFRTTASLWNQPYSVSLATGAGGQAYPVGQVDVHGSFATRVKVVPTLLGTLPGLDGLRVIGAVTNVGNKLASGLRVEVSLRDQHGEQVTAAHATCVLGSLSGSRTSPFYAAFPVEIQDWDPSRVLIRSRAEDTGESADGQLDLSVTSIGVHDSPAGVSSLRVRVRNEGHVPAAGVRVIALALDEHDIPRELTASALDGPTLLPGGAADVDVAFQTISSLRRYEVYPEAVLKQGTRPSSARGATSPCG
jgi:hypothetical protein